MTKLLKRININNSSQQRDLRDSVKPSEDSLLINFEGVLKENDTETVDISRQGKFGRHRANFSQSVLSSQQDNLQNHSQLKSIVSDCYSLQRETKHQHQAIDMSKERVEYFFDEYQKYLEFKKEAGWYESKNVTEQVLKNPQFRLPKIGGGQNKKSKAGSRRSSKEGQDIASMIHQDQ